MALQQLFTPNATAQGILGIEEKGPYQVPVECLTDCRSLFEALAQRELRVPTEMPLILPLQCLKEGLDLDTLGRLQALWWVCTEGSCAREPIIAMLRTGIWKLQLARSSYTRSGGVRNYGTT